MHNIKSANMVINFDLLYDKNFITMEKYETDEKPDFYVKSVISDFDIPDSKYLISKGSSMATYKMGSKKIQIVDLEGINIGKITYVDNDITIEMKERNFTYEYVLTQMVFVTLLEMQDNMVFMHGSTILYKDSAIMFSAPSGTGKSTHANLWIKNSDATIINDDKNVIGLENEKPFIFPNPYSGKHYRDRNIKAELKLLVFLYQSPENILKKMSPKEAMLKILTQIILPKESTKKSWENVIDAMLNLPIYLYGCNMDISAFETLEKEIRGYL